MSLLDEENEKLKKNIIQLLGENGIAMIGGKKSQRGGGTCDIHGEYDGTGECPTCYIKRMNDETQKRRAKKENITQRSIRRKKTY